MDLILIENSLVEVEVTTRDALRTNISACASLEVGLPLPRLRICGVLGVK